MELQAIRHSLRRLYAIAPIRPQILAPKFEAAMDAIASAELAIARQGYHEPKRAS